MESMRAIGLPAGMPEEEAGSELDAAASTTTGTAGSDAGFYRDIDINHLQLLARQLFLYMLRNDFSA